ncbi:MAG TPA: T9SS type A sorting domain-containing protein [Ignavibacteria bacterium]|nr:T9SS type A sorting domain-containing protein [Ignavibacteria bacterium]
MRTVISYILLVLITSGVVISGPSDPVYIQELSGKVKNTVTGLPVSNGHIKVIDYSTVVPKEIARVTIQHNGRYKITNFSVTKIEGVKILAYPSDVVWDGGWGLAYSPTGPGNNGGGGNNGGNWLYTFNLSDAIVEGNKYSLDIDVSWSDFTNKDFKLNQNYPNPFNPVTSISFDLPVSLNVTLKVYNISGEEVAVLADNQFFTAGNNEIQFDGSNLASGIYFYKISSAYLNDIKKMTLIK